jgi:hypothetical protein
MKPVRSYVNLLRQPENEHNYWFTIWFNFKLVNDETTSLLLLTGSKVLGPKETDGYYVTHRSPGAVF